MTAYDQGGTAALAHGDRGHSPVNSVPGQVRQQIVEPAHGAMCDIGDGHLVDLLANLPAADPALSLLCPSHSP